MQISEDVLVSWWLIFRGGWKSAWNPTKKKSLLFSWRLFLGDDSSQKNMFFSMNDPKTFSWISTEREKQIVFRSSRLMRERSVRWRCSMRRVISCQQDACSLALLWHNSFLRRWLSCQWRMASVTYDMFHQYWRTLWPTKPSLLIKLADKRHTDMIDRRCGYSAQRGVKARMNVLMPSSAFWLYHELRLHYGPFQRVVI